MGEAPLVVAGDMRFYCHVMREGDIWRDAEFASAAQVLAHAAVIASELDDGTFPSGSLITIAVKNHREIGAVPIAPRR